MDRSKRETYALLLLGGSGLRFGGETLKQFRPIEGKPLFRYAFDALAQSDKLQTIILSVKRGTEQTVADFLNGHDNGKDILFAPGGQTRAESVFNALSLIPEEDGIVLIQDGDRPNLSETLIDRCLDKAREIGAAIVASPATDSMLMVEDKKAREYLPRESLYRAQTPQAFKLSLLKSHFHDYSHTDEGSLLLEAGCPVGIIEGSEENLKINTIEDEERFLLMLKRRKQ